MGDPRKIRKKFSTPDHPWRKERIDLEKELLNQYGLRRKYEVWKMNSMLQQFLNRAKTIIGQRSSQSEMEKSQLLTRLYLLGLLKKDARVEDVLNLTLKDVLERRLQTLVVRKNMAKTMRQARQFITHNFVVVSNRKITTPSYIVSVEEEPSIKLVREIVSNPEAAPAEKKAQQQSQPN